MPAIADLPKLIEARQRFANGPQMDLFQHASCIGFVRHGTAEHPGCVVAMSNAAASDVLADLGEDFAGARFVDFLGNCSQEVIADDQGRAHFPAESASVSVWVRTDCAQS